jgi:signal transduction histidine kinase
VLEKLGNNADKYCRSQRIIQLSLSKKEDRAEIAVHKEGNEIPHEEQKSLFDTTARILQKSGKSG